VDESRIEQAWGDANGTRLLEESFGDGEPDRTIDFDPDAGYRLFARHFGLALISPDGGKILCAPPGTTDWSWQRFMIGRILPWAALIQGREVFHASAVRVGDQVVAFVAASGVGKTSLALQLVLQGAGFFTDDVLALETAPDGVIAHPGANITAVRPSVRSCFEDDEWSRLGVELGHSVKTYVEIEREPAPLPLGAIYFLAPATTRTRYPEEVDARELLGGTFITDVGSGPRLRGLLDCCAAVSTHVPMRRLWIEPECGARAAAREVLEQTTTRSS
jgi:hypothetical protein